MKKLALYIIAILALAQAACKKNDYAEGALSPIIAVVDLKDLYKGSDVKLTTENMGGAQQIVGVVISNTTSGNSPAGLLVIQNDRRKEVRGIAIEIGDAASNYLPGDSVTVQVTNATLTRVNGSMRLKGVSADAVTKVSENHTIKVRSVPSSTLMASPDNYENTLITVSNSIVEPEPQPGDTFSGDKTINDGFGKMTVHVEPGATFANDEIPPSANFTGVPVIANGKLVLWPRTADDVFELPLIKPSPIIITGYLTDPTGVDANYEYIQFMATRDIDFAETSFAVVTTNNAGSNPAPENGWAQGLARTYKFNLTSGKVSKGQLFYVGGNKNIYGAGSTDISTANWIVSRMYATVPGDDFGAVTANLLANSGNVAGVSVFSGIAVTSASVPLDVIMYGGNGNVYSPGPPEVGYRITNTDYYSTINPVTRLDQSFYGAGTNTSKLTLPATSNFSQLGGVYDAATGRWTKGRTVTSIPLTPTSPLSTIESGDNLTIIVN
ncbi:hypothetical protein EOD41_02740 [Mucilaginibacter limnophilus]|uniref:DUF5689 domain-containing protein n=1 Tax=Mucilaginibacter limnophilus TaxID=1932778 RepID=A0A3S2UPJ7_9SPHI|nr:DUF5689 domain-containing protein [Mucilaginibacter limnophilus]RVU02871.1 hypothetical protein EOD41_02740 [Mucilaginibacter limnophilus]